MLTLLSILGRKATWFVASVIVVWLLLSVANVVRTRVPTAYRDAKIWQGSAAALAAGEQPLRDYARQEMKVAGEKRRALATAGPSALDQLEQSVKAGKAAAERRLLTDKQVFFKLATGQTPDVLQSYRARYVDLPLLDHATDAIQLRRIGLADAAERARRVASYQARRRRYLTDADRHNRKVAVLEARERALAADSRAIVCRRTDVPVLCSPYRKAAADRRTFRAEQLGLNTRRERLRREAAALAAARATGTAIAAVPDVLGEAMRAYRERIRDTNEHARTGTVAWVERNWRSYGGTALLIVIGAVLLPLVHRLVAFLVIAPLARRARPIRLGTSDAPMRAWGFHSSLSVEVDRTTELLLRGGVHTRAADLTARDKPLLAWSMPFTSLAAGLYNLQGFRSDRPVRITVTALDPHGELAMIALAAGSALTVQPRALLGFLRPLDQRLTITRPWRLGQLLAWATLRLRFVVVHGPCQLLVEGRRGILVEHAGPPPGRAVSRGEVIGWQVGLDQGVARTSSLLAYLRGRAPLFDTAFSGAGAFVTARAAGRAGARGWWGRGLRGLGDAALNVLGI